MKSKLGINLFFFIIRVFVGFILIKIIPSNIKDIVIYPTPDNCKKVQYKDFSSECFEFEHQEVSCTEYNDIKQIPFQS